MGDQNKPPSSDESDLVRRLNEIAIRRVREFVARFRQLEEYERFLSKPDDQEKEPNVAALSVNLDKGSL